MKRDGEGMRGEGKEGEGKEGKEKEGEALGPAPLHINSGYATGSKSLAARVLISGSL